MLVRTMQVLSLPENYSLSYVGAACNLYRPASALRLDHSLLRHLKLLGPLRESKTGACFLVVASSQLKFQ